MWESITSILTSTNAVWVLGFITLILVIALVAVRKGWFYFNKKGIQIGKIQSSERNIISTQIQKVESFVRDTYFSMGYSDTNWRARFVCSEIEDVLYKAVAVNHISNNQTYVMLKQDAIWNCVLSYAPDKATEELKHDIYDYTKELIKQLVGIREYFEGEIK